MALIQSLSTEAIIALINAGTWPQQFSIVAGDLTTSGTALVADVSKAAKVVLHVKNTGVAADIAGVFAFEASIDSTNGTDGTWVPIQATRSNDKTVENGRAAASLAGGVASSYAWEALVSGYQWFRIRCTTGVTATAIDRWSIVRTTFGDSPNNIMVKPSPGSALGNTLVSTASINNNNIVGFPGQLMEISIFNPTAAIVYVKLYNKATAPAPATDNALLIDVIPVAINGRVGIEYGFLGKRFSSGLGIAIVANPANTDATVVAAGVDVSLTFI